MNEYAFECTIWIKSTSVEAAHKELHDEFSDFLELEHNLFALETEDGTKDTSEANLYAFESTVWVRGLSGEAAGEELHREVDCFFAQDNNLIALRPLVVTVPCF